MARARKQHMPMRFPGLLGEGRRHGDDVGAPGGERPVERGEAEVVADAHAEPAPGQIDNHGLAAGTKVRDSR